MSNINKFKQPYFNLLIDNDPETWENGVTTIDRSRFLESTYGNKFENNNSTLHGAYLEELIQYPCLFLYEELSVTNNNIPIMGYIGHISSFHINHKSITINFKTEVSLSMKDIFTIEKSLQINSRGYGLNRSHWAVKNGNIYDIIESYRHLLENQNIRTKPKVFFSYSWDSSETKNMVGALAVDLRDNGVEVIYDKSHLRPGQSLNYFMEHIDRDDFDKVYIFCDKSYLHKAKNRLGGVGKEVQLLSNYVYNHPGQTKVFPLFIEDNYNAPSFLNDTFGLNLHQQNWVNDVEIILNDIFN